LLRQEVHKCIFSCMDCIVR